MQLERDRERERGHEFVKPAAASAEASAEPGRAVHKQDLRKLKPDNENENVAKS